MSDRVEKLAKELEHGIGLTPAVRREAAALLREQAGQVDRAREQRDFLSRKLDEDERKLEEERFHKNEWKASFHVIRQRLDEAERKLEEMTEIADGWRDQATLDADRVVTLQRERDVAWQDAEEARDRATHWHDAYLEANAELKEARRERDEWKMLASPASAHATAWLRLMARVEALEAALREIVDEYDIGGLEADGRMVDVARRALSPQAGKRDVPLNSALEEVREAIGPEGMARLCGERPRKEET